jgi:hypothetical protein
MKIRRMIAAVNDHTAFLSAWMLALAILAVVSFWAFGHGRMDVCAGCAVAAGAILAVVTWMNEVATSIRSSAFG